MEPIVVVGGPYHGALHAQLEAQASGLEERGIDLELTQDDMGDEPVLVCRFEPCEPASLCRSAVAAAVAHVIGEECRSDWVTRLLQREYSYFDPAERHELVRFVDRRLKRRQTSEREGPSRRLVESISHYLTEERHLCLDGFLTFRLRDYRRRLAGIVDQAVDEYLLEREYREFVRLLRYFVEHQDPEAHLLHAVIGRDQEFHLLTGACRPLESASVDRVLADLTKENLEAGDLFVSALVTVAPKQLVVHGLGRFDEETQETVRRVFGERLQHCRHGCGVCHTPSAPAP